MTSSIATIPNTERWDRSNGRIYRMQYDSTYKPKKVNLASLDDAKLVELHRARRTNGSPAPRGACCTNAR